MPILTIRHVTTYRYRQPVAFGEHRMMLRPRDAHDQRLIDLQLDISPAPSSLRFIDDAHGNRVGIARFETRAAQLRFDATVRVEHVPAEPRGHEIEDYAQTYPFRYSDEDMPDLACSIERHHVDPDNEVAHWAKGFVRRESPTGTFALLLAITEAIHDAFEYRARSEKGIQEPALTLRLGRGSCRDFALLMIEAVRSLGLAARFASGYLAIPDADARAAAGGATHAWAQVYLPGAGWIDFDPTTGSVGKKHLVTVATVRDPRQALPLHGTWIGFPSDHLGMTVDVKVTATVPARRASDEPGRRSHARHRRIEEGDEGTLGEARN
jgi:transglutaminase-like putative cysteine protease